MRPIYYLFLAALLIGSGILIARRPWRHYHDGPAYKRTRCRSEIQDLDIALNIYRDGHGRYHGYELYPPDGGVRGETAALAIYLDGNPTNGGPAEILCIFDPDRLRANEYIDPWGEPYHYDELLSEAHESSGDKNARPPAKVNIYSFDLWSTAGEPDSSDGEEWITNYREVR